MKRTEYLQPLSREHHHGLLLCWKIRTGLSKNVEISRIKKYADWFYENHIKAHFEAEEKYIFPILGPEDEMVQEAIASHRKLKELFNGTKDVENSLKQIEKELEGHIRFEERILFNKIQEVASPDQVKLIDDLHTEHKFEENSEDEFWK